MEPDKILNANILDILFEGKNKAYGAYDLRKNYNKRVTVALAGMVTVCLPFFITQLLANSNSERSNTTPVTDVYLDHIQPEEKLPEVKPIEPPKAAPTQAAVTQYVTPLITKDELVDEPLPEVEDLAHTQIGLITQDGAPDVDVVAAPVEASTGVVEVIKPKEEDFEKVFIKVEREAKFPGGVEGWKKYLERNLNANVAADDGAPLGNYTVKVQFIVDKQGNVSNVEALEMPKACPGCGPEAIKVIKRGPKWEPAVQNDHKVNYQAVQFITFQVAE